MKLTLLAVSLMLTACGQSVYLGGDIPDGGIVQYVCTSDPSRGFEEFLERRDDTGEWTAVITKEGIREPRPPGNYVTNDYRACPYTITADGQFVE